MERHTYQTGLIGNCAFLAHVHKNTNIEWLCWPRFDSTFIFGGLLDHEKGGEFSIRPATEYTSKQYYRENTNVLCTEITCQNGKYRITDFAPRFKQYERFFKPLMLIRKVELIEGNPRIQVKCEPVTEYGLKKLRPCRGSNHIQFQGGDEMIRLTTNIPISYIVDQQHFILNEPKYLVLTYGDPLEVPLKSTAEHFLAETVSYWRTWIKHASIAQFYQQYVIRSALALKIHQFEDTGAIIAASTTSLPESPGSGRNWDYRFCWLRDTYYVLTSLNHIGQFEEMEHSGLDTSFVQVNAELPTGVVDVLLDAEGKATYTIAQPVAWDAIGFDRALSRLVPRADAIVFGSLICRDKRSRDTLFRVLDHARLKVFDLNLRPPHVSPEDLVQLLQMSSVLKVNDEELVFLKTLFRLEVSQEYNSTFRL